MEWECPLCKKNISVIVPVYNVERYLHRCLDSILSQTYQNLEIILVDDGSTDASSEICDEYKNKDSRIKVCHQKNEGLSAARNKGMELCSGEYIVFVDSDDYIHPQMIEILYRGIIESGTKLSVCGYKKVYFRCNDANIELAAIKYTVCDAIKLLKLRYDGGDAVFVISAWNKMYHRDLFQKYRYPVGRIYEDNYLTPQILCDIEKVCITDVELYYYYQRSDSITHTDLDKKKIIDEYDFIEENRLTIQRTNDAELILKVEMLPLIYAYKLMKREEIRDNKELWDFSHRLYRNAYEKYINNEERLVRRIIYGLMRYMPRMYLALLEFKKKRNFGLEIRSILNNMKRAKEYSTCKKNTVFLVGVPEYGNLGGQAITFSQVEFVHCVLPQYHVRYIKLNQFDDEKLCMRLYGDKKDNIFLMYGGGNMGTVYRREEYARLYTIKHIKKAKLVVFPQSVGYKKNTDEASRAATIYENKARLKMFAREKYSYEKMKQIFPKAKSGLVPDIVMQCNPQLPSYERNGVVVCARNDIEASLDSKEIIENIVDSFVSRGKNITIVDTDKPEFAVSLDQQKRNIQAMLEKFASCELVITDRLHGMIFSVITKTPCIAVDNSTGKIGHFYHTWLEDSGVVFIDDKRKVDDALSKPICPILFDRESFLTNYQELKEYMVG